MHYFPAALQDLADQFARLPGIGGKTAQRLAFHVLGLPLADAQAFADEYAAGLAGRQWMCGMPEKYVVIGAGNCVITAFGLADIIEYFKTTSTATLTGATVLAEGDITE